MQVRLALVVFLEISLYSKDAEVVAEAERLTALIQKLREENAALEKRVAKLEASLPKPPIQYQDPGWPQMVTPNTSIV